MFITKEPLGLMGSKGPVSALELYKEYQDGSPCIPVLSNKYGLTIDQTFRLLEIGESQTRDLRITILNELSKRD